MPESLEKPQVIVDKKPPYGYLTDHLDLLGDKGRNVSRLLTNCHQCSGSGYDSPKKQAGCCSCYGLGKLFTDHEGNLLNYRKQRNLVKHMRDEYLAQSKED